MKLTLTTRRLLCYFALVALAAPMLAASGHDRAVAGSVASPPLFARLAFEHTWQRTDRPVHLGEVARSYYWGPQANTGGILEEYDQGVNGKRVVQYFDKSRMEINNPNGNPDDPFFVTNGLLTVELMAGRMQVGNSSYVNRPAADIPLASDTDDPHAPTYLSFQGVSNTPLGNHYAAATRVGQFATATINKAGQVGDDPAKATVPGTRIAQFNWITYHNIPQAIWDFLNLSGPIYNPATGQNSSGALADPWFYATGYPISEPYWAKVKIANVPNVDVLIQAFERRVVTYVPSAPDGYKVQMSNIGQHYYDWRYGNSNPDPAPTQTPAPNPTPVGPQPTITATAVPVPQHTAAQFEGTWLSRTPNTGHSVKFDITRNGNHLTVHGFSACGDAFCDLGEDDAVYSGEPLKITLSGHSFKFSFVDPGATKLQLEWQNSETLFFRRTTADDYEGAWLNVATNPDAAKLAIKANNDKLTVQWFEVCGQHICDKESKTQAYNGEPFEITLDGKLFKIALSNVDRTKLTVHVGSAPAADFSKLKPADYDGTWETQPHLPKLKLEISHTGDTIHVLSHEGQCIDLPCTLLGYNTNAQFNGEPLVVENTQHSFTFKITFDSTAGNRLKVVRTGGNNPAYTYYVDKQP